MPRTKEFDPQTTLDKALHVFHAKGYTATSMQDLLDAMGINRASLYTTYGDKASLFQQALQRYFQTAGAEQMACIFQEGTARDVFALMFAHIIRERETQGSLGCMIVNSAIEIGNLPPDSQTTIKEVVLQSEEMYYQVLKTAYDRKEISSEPRQLAKAMVAAVMGLRVLVRAGVEAPTLRAAADKHLELIR